MNIKEALSRSFNLLVTSILGLAAFAFAPEIIFETELPFKGDDITLLVIGIIAIGWYLLGNNRFKLSMTPVVLLALAALVKISAVFIEISEADDVGDDFGGMILFVLALGLVLYQYVKTKKLVAAAGE